MIPVCKIPLVKILSTVFNTDEIGYKFITFTAHLSLKISLIIFIYFSIILKQHQQKLDLYKNPFHMHINKNLIHNTKHIQYHSYKILCINLIKDIPKPEKASAMILEHLKLPEESFRLGKTKVQD